MTTVSLQSPSSVSSSSVLLFGTWHVRHSNRAFWQGRRNVQAEGTYNYRSPGLPLSTLPFSFQDQGSREVKTFTSMGWKVLGRGKDGKLESWMHETKAGIEDSSGEVRADWRPEWIVLYFPATSPAPAGIDILCNRDRRLSDGTVQEIHDALNKLEGEDDQLWKLPILDVPQDGDRDQELRDIEKRKWEEWEKRTGPAEGISPDLTYDDDDKATTGLKCILQ